MVGHGHHDGRGVQIVAYPMLDDDPPRHHPTGAEIADDMHKESERVDDEVHRGLRA